MFLLSGNYSQRGEGHGREQGRRPAEQAALAATGGGGRLAAGSLALCPDRHHPAWRSSSMAAGGAADRPGESCASGQHGRGTGGLAGVPDGNPVPSQDGLPGRMVQWEGVLPCRSTMGGMGKQGRAPGCCGVDKMAAKYVIGEQRRAAARRRHPSLRPVPLLPCSARERQQLFGTQTCDPLVIAIAAVTATLPPTAALPAPPPCGPHPSIAQACCPPKPRPCLPPGVDGGTESIRAGVFDLSGTPLSFASQPYPTSFPHPGWAEQDPADWWAAWLCACIPSLLFSDCCALLACGSCWEFQPPKPASHGLAQVGWPGRRRARGGCLGWHPDH